MVDGQSSDAKLWAGVSIEQKLSKQLAYSIEIEQRLYNNFSSFDRTFFQPSLSYKLNKHWSLGINYRIWNRQTIEQEYFLHHRATLGIDYGNKIHGFKWKIYSKIQYGLPDVREFDFYVTKKLVNRNSAKISYKIFGSRYTPFMKYELFTLLDRLQAMNYQWRILGGTNFYINEFTDLRLFYLYEHEYNVLNRTDSYIWGISLRYSL